MSRAEKLMWRMLIRSICLTGEQLAMASMFGMEMKADGQPVDLKEVQGKLKVVVSFLTVSKDENAWFAV
jgi:hypothetical protein